MGFSLASTNGRLPYTRLRLDIMKGIAFMKKRDDSGVLGRGDGTHGGGRKERSD